MTTTIGIRRRLDVTERRDSLLALIKHARRPIITTKAAQTLYSGTPWAGIGRNATRRDLRDLAHRGQLLPVTIEGQRAFLLNPKRVDRHPVSPQQSGHALLHAIASEGGEWTPGRAKVVLRRAAGTNIYRSVASRHLDTLHRDGLLELHSERPGHCFYTSLIEGGAA